jgi:hypothetical protein
LLHFSAASMSNPSGPPPGSSLAEQNLAQALENLTALLHTGPVPLPPPPDIDPGCDPSSDDIRAQGQTYASLAFAPDNYIIQDVLNAEQALVQATGSNPGAGYDFATIQQVVTLVIIPEVNQLFANYSSQGRKVWAVWMAAGFVQAFARQYYAQNTGWQGQITSWLQGATMDYYFKQLTQKDDYTRMNTLRFVQKQVDMNSGDNSGDTAFLQRLANAYTFKASIDVTVAGDQGNGAGPINLEADGLITLTPVPDPPNDLSQATLGNFGFRLVFRKCDRDDHD